MCQNIIIGEDTSRQLPYSTRRNYRAVLRCLRIPSITPRYHTTLQSMRYRWWFTAAASSLQTKPTTAGHATTAAGQICALLLNKRSESPFAFIPIDFFFF